MKEIEKLMIDSKASWQTRHGLQGEAPEQVIAELPPVPKFVISDSSADASRIGSGKNLLRRPNPDGTYMN